MSFTLIIGAKCKDCIVLVGGRKASGERNDSYIEKIRRCTENGDEEVDFAVFGAAGIGSSFEGFLTLLPTRVKAHSKWIWYDNNRLLSQHNRLITIGLVQQGYITNYCRRGYNCSLRTRHILQKYV